MSCGLSCGTYKDTCVIILRIPISGVYQQTYIPVVLSLGVKMPFWIFSLQGLLLFELYLITRCLLNKSLFFYHSSFCFLLTMSVLPVLFWPCEFVGKKPWYVLVVVVYFLMEFHIASAYLKDTFSRSSQYWAFRSTVHQGRIAWGDPKLKWGRIYCCNDTDTGGIIWVQDTITVLKYDHGADCFTTI